MSIVSRKKRWPRSFWRNAYSGNHIDKYWVPVVYDISDIIAPVPDFDSEVYFNLNLGAVDVRRMFDWYRQWPYWYYQDYRPGLGPLPFAGPMAVGSDSVDRFPYTRSELEKMIQDLIESEEAR